MSRGNNAPWAPEVGGYVRYISHLYYFALAQHEKKDLVFLSAVYTSSQISSVFRRILAVPKTKSAAFGSNSTLTDVPISLSWDVSPTPLGLYPVLLLQGYEHLPDLCGLS